MKKLISLLMAFVAVVTFQSCVEDETDDSFSAKVVTLDVTDVTSSGFTFHATIEYSGGSACAPSGGIYFDSTPKSAANHDPITTETVTLSRGTNKIDSKQINILSGDIYIFRPGQKVYYYAYAKVYTPGNGDQFVYGEEKSFTVPEK